MGKFTCYYCPNSKGKFLAKDFVKNRLDKSEKVKFFHIREHYLEEYGPFLLAKSHVEYLRDKIHALRIQSDRGWIRIFFFCTNRKILLTHGYIKKERKTSPAECEKAIKIRREYLGRKKTGE